MVLFFASLLIKPFNFKWQSFGVIIEVTILLKMLIEDV